MNCFIILLLLCCCGHSNGVGGDNSHNHSCGCGDNHHSHSHGCSENNKDNSCNRNDRCEDDCVEDYYDQRCSDDDRRAPWQGTRDYERNDYERNDYYVRNNSSYNRNDTCGCEDK